MSTNENRAEATNEYIRRTFGGLASPIDDQLDTLMPRAIAAGLPDIAVSADVGRLLMLLASLASREPGAGRGVEVGALGGYSALWIARGLGPRGRLITIEPEPAHARFARTEFERAGMADRIELREDTGLNHLPKLLTELSPESLDFVFFDAIKHEYLDYARLALPLLRPGGLLVADNCLGGGSSWWITDAPGTHPSRDGVVRFNDWISRPESGFLAAIVTNREGLVVARKLAPGDTLSP
ncbi:MAG: class I SAM-dependent methyltransferase [Phycisphaerales bacterium]|jgi:predicted O-methyltransferase YrrM|nr:class I SAM-dependent methyltransferase [Phycisphaerales bacterium]